MHARNAVFVLIGVALVATGAEPAPQPFNRDLPRPQAPVRLRATDLPVPIGQAALDKQFTALAKMPRVNVTYGPMGNVSLLQGDIGMDVQSRRESDIPREVLAKFSDVLIAAGTEELLLQSDTTDDRYRNIILSESIRGIPVVRSTISVRTDPRSGRVVGFAAGFLPDRGLPREPSISVEEAAQKLTSHLEASLEAEPGTVKIAKQAPLAYFALYPERRPQLVWELNVSYVRAADRQAVNELVWVDATDGSIAAREPTSVALNEVYRPTNANSDWANLTTDIPTKITQLTEAQIASDAAALNARANLDVTQARWTAVAGYAAPTTRSVIRFTFDSPNARFFRHSGINYLVYHLPTSTTKSYGDSLDTVAHEYGHGVESTAGYFNPFYGDAQGAALSEAFADISATLVDVASNGLTDNTWRMSEGLRISNPTRAIRSMKDPGDVQTTFFLTQRDWYPVMHLSPADNSAHGNSTIVTHAFYLLSQGGFHARAGQPQLPPTRMDPIPSLFVNPLGYATAREIFIDAAKSQELLALNGLVNIKQFRTAAVNAATARFGAVAAQSVQRAFQAVGLDEPCGTAPPPMPALNVVNEYCFGKYSLDWAHVPGATHYEVKRFAALLGWDSAQLISTGFITQCGTQVGSTYGVRMRACNQCGCSDWTASQGMYYTNGCL